METRKFVSGSMPSVLLAWIGRTDLRASAGDADAGIGPIAQVIQARQFDAVVLLSNYPAKEARQFVAWLGRRGAPPVSLRNIALASPTRFPEIYPAAVEAIEDVLKRFGVDTQLTYHLSPGTSAMAAVWAILAKTRFAAELVQSSREEGVQTASLPFEMSPDFVTDLLRKPDEELRRLSEGLPRDAPEFDKIIRQDVQMNRVIAQARWIAPRDAPVLIQGESGTGKELFAEAIHNASPRAKGPFIEVNCGAIAPELFESEFFGHKKGSFTGAQSDRIGHFEKASGGTLFLDEIGDLPLGGQVKLLRAIQEGEVTRVGESNARKVSVRVIAATNRDLLREVADSRFREDLFHRLAVAVLKMPPLRERRTDIDLLADYFMERINREAAGQPGYEAKTVSDGARNVLRHHPWPGNVRELYNTLFRASMWCPGKSIGAEDIRQALFSIPSDRRDILGRPLGNGLDIRELISEVATHYIGRALEETRGVKTEAAKLVGLPSYQTLTNWIERFGLASKVARQLRSRGRTGRTRRTA